MTSLRASVLPGRFGSTPLLRAGYGRFFSYQETRTGDPFQLYYNVPFVVEPNYQSDGTVPALTVSGGFPAVDPNNITGGSVTTSAEGADTRLHAPVLDEWNLNIQQELPGNMLLEVAYVGSKATHLQSYARSEPGSDSRPRRHPVETALSAVRVIFNIVDRGNSNYNALQVKVEKRMTPRAYVPQLIYLQQVAQRSA